MAGQPTPCPSGLAVEFDGSLASLFMPPSRSTLADINSCIAISSPVLLQPLAHRDGVSCTWC